jgi:hypothetical protein
LTFQMVALFLISILFDFRDARQRRIPISPRQAQSD